MSETVTTDVYTSSEKASSWVGRLLVRGINWAGAKRARLTLRHAMVQGERIPYYEGGRDREGTPLVLLHGLSDGKASFVRTAAALPRQRRMLLPDLRGHGDAPYRQGASHDIAGQVGWLAQFLDACQCRRVDLAGNSMGGHISLAFTVRFPERVRRLVLVNAPGAGADPSAIYTGYPEPIRSADDLMKIFARVFHRPPRLPGPVVRHLLHDIAARREVINEIAHAVREGSDTRLDAEIANIEIPVLLLWGMHDMVVPPVVLQTYRERIRNNRVVELDAGHSPQMEVPERVANAIADFIGQVD